MSTFKIRWSLPLICAGLMSACKSADSPTAGSESPVSASALTVQLASPRYVEWPELVQGSGALTAWQEEIISTETGSYRIVALLVDVGAAVRKGQPLAELSRASLEADLRKQLAVLSQAVAEKKQAAGEARRARAVADTGALSPQKIDEYTIAEETKQAAVDSAQADVDSTRLQLTQTRIVAVDDGVVSSRSAVLGNVVSTGTELFRLLRDGRVEWRLELDARQLARVRAGQPAELVLPDGSSISGRVRQVAPTISTTTGRGLVYVSLPLGSGAQAGSYASGSVVTGTRGGWTLPESSIVTRDGRTYVYTIDAQQHVHRQSIETGRRHEGRVEVVHGLPTDSRVAASGGSFLSEGATVTVVTEPGGERP